MTVDSDVKTFHQLVLDIARAIRNAYEGGDLPERAKQTWLEVLLNFGRRFIDIFQNVRDYLKSLGVNFGELRNIIRRRIWDVIYDSTVDYTKAESWYLHPSHESTRAKVEYVEYRNSEGEWTRTPKSVKLNANINAKHAVCYIQGVEPEALEAGESDRPREEVIRCFLSALDLLGDYRLFAPRVYMTPLLSGQSPSIGRIWGSISSMRAAIAEFDQSTKALTEVTKEKEDNKGTRTLVCSSQASLLMNFALAQEKIVLPTNMRVVLTGAFDAAFYKSVVPRDLIGTLMSDGTSEDSKLLKPIVNFITENFMASTKNLNVNTYNLAINDGSRFVAPYRLTRPPSSAVVVPEAQSSMCLPGPNAPEMLGGDVVSALRHLAEPGSTELYDHEDFSVVVQDSLVTFAKTNGGRLVATVKIANYDEDDSITYFNGYVGRCADPNYGLHGLEPYTVMRAILQPEVKTPP
jgi:hypothetical protein